MTRTTKLLTLGAVGIIGFITATACNKAPEVTATQPITTTAATPETTVATAPDKEVNGFEGLKAVISQTKAAVESGDFTTAASEFEHFEDYWQEVEDDIKDNDPDTYEAIETQMETVMDGLKASQPETDTLLGALQALDTDITSAAN